MKAIPLKALVLALFLLASTPLALADSMTFTIDIPNHDLAVTPGPYATVLVETVTGNVNLNGVITDCSAGCIEIDVAMLSTFKMFGKAGGSNNGAFGFDYTGFIGDLTISNLPTGFSVNSPLGPGQMDGFGDFDVIIFDGNPPNAHSSLSFLVSKSGGFSAIAPFITDTSCGGEFCGAHFAVHVAPGGTIPTGFAGDSGTQVPEPSSLALLGAGLIGLGRLVRRKL